MKCLRIGDFWLSYLIIFCFVCYMIFSWFQNRNKTEIHKLEHAVKSASSITEFHRIKGDGVTCTVAITLYAQNNMIRSDAPAMVSMSCVK